MSRPADDSERILRQAGGALARQRASTRTRGRPIGRGSARLRARHRRAKAGRILAAVVLIVLVASGAGLVADGIGLGGLFLTVLAIVAAVFLLARYPRLKVPGPADLNRGSAGELVARTELWLEMQRPALPPPAVDLVDRIGGQLDSLGHQLEGLDQKTPAVREVRGLVGEHLPALIASYRRIPPALRSDDRGGQTADEQLAAGLGKISSELDEVTRQLAAGDLDNLAIRGRYLDYRYGGELEAGSQG